ncbi:MAG: GNAT family N-acetyltransferase [Pseudomonadota bacterium]
MVAPAQQITIRHYVPEDLDRLIELLRELQAHEQVFEPRMKPPEALGADYFDGLLDDMKSQGGAILIAENRSIACGYAVYLTHVPNDDEDEIDYTYAYVSDVAVTAEARGRGVGRMLLDACERGAREAGAQVLRISVLSQNERAIGLYRSFGFSDRVTELEKRLNE